MALPRHFFFLMEPHRHGTAATFFLSDEASPPWHRRDVFSF
jgi:hypothetical protein